MFNQLQLKTFRLQWLRKALVLGIFVFAVATISVTPISAQTTATFEEIFADNSAGWESATYDLKTTIRNGILYLALNGNSIFSYSASKRTFSADSEIEVEGRLSNVTKTEDSNEVWGIVFRSSAREGFSNQLYFVLENQSSWCLYGLDSARKFKTLRGGFFTEKVDLSEYHRLKVTMRGNTFVLYFDDKRLYGFTDTSNVNRPPRLSYAGLVVGNGKKTSTIEAVFRKFTVSQLPPPPATQTPTRRPNLTATPRPKFTATPLPTSAPIAQNLFADSSSWRVVNGNGTFLIADNKLTLSVEGTTGQSTLITSDALQIPRDADISFTLDPMEVPRIGAWNLGLGIRVTGANPVLYHNLRVFSNKIYTFLYRQDMLTTILIEYNGQAKALDWKKPNRIRLVVKGDTATFYLNGVKIQEFIDETLVTTDNTFGIALTGGIFPEDSNSVKLKATFSDLVIRGVD